MKIERLFLMSMGVIGVFVVVLAAQTVPPQLSTLQTRTRMVYAIDAYGGSLRALQQVATERTPYFSLLFAKAPATAEQAAQVKKLQAATDEALATAAIAVDALDPTLRPTLDHAAAALKDIRIRADGAIAQPHDLRDAAAVSGYLPQIALQVDALDTLTNALARSLLSDATVSIFAQIARDTQDLRLSAGIRGSTLARAVGNSRPLTPDELTAIDKSMGRIELNWKKAKVGIELAGAPAPLRAAEDEAERSYIKGAMLLADQQIQAGREGRPYPENNAGVTTSVVAALGKVLAVRDAALDLARVKAIDDRQAAMASLAATAVIVLLTLAGCIGVTLLLRRRIVGPLTVATATVARLARGETDLVVAGHDRSDELGQLAGAIETLRQNAIAAREAAEETAQAQAARQHRATRIEALTKAFDERSQSLISSVHDNFGIVNQQAADVSNSSGEADQASCAVRQASETTLGMVQSVSGRVRELAQSSAEMASRVGNSRQVAVRAVDEAEQASRRLDGLAQASERIGDVVRLISDIASQTNLLALNATIEAARAGEAGKGFAVVTGEVKSLANQTAKATDEITQQIAAIQAEAVQAVQTITGIGRTIGDLSSIAEVIAGSVEQQNASTSEIAQTVNQTAEETRAMSVHVTVVGNSTEMSSAAVAELQQVLRMLDTHIADLTSEISNFIGTIRAA